MPEIPNVLFLPFIPAAALPQPSMSSVRPTMASIQEDNLKGKEVTQTEEFGNISGGLIKFCRSLLLQLGHSSAAAGCSAKGSLSSPVFMTDPSRGFTQL